MTSLGPSTADARRNRSPRKSRDETGIDNAARSALPARLVLHPTSAKPRKLYGKPALVSSPRACSPGRGVAACLRGRRKRSPRKSRDETGSNNAALSAPPGRLVLHPTPAKPRKLGRKPALVSSLSRLARLLGGGGSPERTGLVPSMRLLPLIGRNRSAEKLRWRSRTDRRQGGPFAPIWSSAIPDRIARRSR